MKVPDNIVVKKEEIKMQSDNLVGVAWRKNYDNSQYVEYIRKDALMEWIDEKQNSLDLHDEYEAGRYDGLQEMIDKINSM